MRHGLLMGLLVQTELRLNATLYLRIKLASCTMSSLLKRPPQSPDLHPTQHFWDVVVELEIYITAVES